MSELVGLARGGDDDALIVLLDRCRKQVTSGVIAAAGSFGREDRRDAESEAFLAIWRSFPSFRGESGPCTWMYGVARRTAAKRVVHREIRHRRIAERLEELTTAAVTEGPEEHHSDLDLAAFVFAALPPDHREVLVLHVIQELSYEEIAAELFVSVGTVGSRLSRARSAAAQILREAGR